MLIKISNPIHQQVLQQINLFHLGELDRAEFAGYVPFAYQNSETEAMDEIYRMYERVLVHRQTGLRIAYLTTENYDGDQAEYSVMDCFVITQENQKHRITNIDLEKELFETSEGVLPFHAIRKSVNKED